MSYPTSDVRGSGQEEQPHIQRAAAVWPQEARGKLPHVRCQGQRPRGATPHPKSGGCVAAGGPRRATPRRTSGAVAKRSNPTSKEQWLGGCRRPETATPRQTLGRWPRRAIPRQTSGCGQEEQPHIQRAAAAWVQKARGELPYVRRQGRRPRRAIPCQTSGAAAERSNPTFKEQRLRGPMRAERSYSTFKVRRGDFVQDKEQRLCFAGAAVKR